MTQKFPTGTTVRIKEEYALRPDLRGMIFFVDVVEFDSLVDPSVGRLPDTYCYKTPFEARSGKGLAWVQEEWLELYDPDQGFEYLEDWSAWTPPYEKVHGYAYANA